MHRGWMTDIPKWRRSMWNSVRVDGSDYDLVPLGTLALFPRRHQWECTVYDRSICLGYTQKMHKHTPTCPCTSMRLTWETLGKSPGFWHHTCRDLLTMASGDWETENRTRSVISSCTLMLAFKIKNNSPFRCAETHRHKQIHSHTWNEDEHT